MDRQAAVKIVKDTFESPFDKGRFVNLTKNGLHPYDWTGRVRRVGSGG